MIPEYLKNKHGRNQIHHNGNDRLIFFLQVVYGLSWKNIEEKHSNEN